MKTRLIGLAFALGLVGATAFAVPAQAADTATGAVSVPCSTGWYVNPDETDRKPTVAAIGLKFEPADLIHHATIGTVTVETLAHGTFEASPTPSQDSFFSVEVYGADGGYATLRWNTTTSRWDMVTGGQLYSNTDPAVLVDMPASHKSHHVISFGVGYTLNPPGDTPTTVTSITFQGTKYDLACKSTTAVPPTYTKPTCTTTGIVKLPTTEGVTYTAKRNVVNGVTVSATVTATANDGYKLVGTDTFGPYDVAKLTGDQCKTPSQSPSTSPSASPSPTKSPVAVPVVTDSPSNLPPVNNAGNTLPKTGDKFPLGEALMYAGGAILIGIGAVLLGRRRRGTSDDTVQFTV